MLCRVIAACLEIGKPKVVLHEEAVALAVTDANSEHQVGSASWCRTNLLCNITVLIVFYLCARNTG